MIKTTNRKLLLLMTIASTLVVPHELAALAYSMTRVNIGNSQCGV